MDTGKLQLSWPIFVILTYSVKCWPNIIEAVKSRNSRISYPDMRWKLFHSAPKIPVTIFLTVCYLLQLTFQLWQFFVESNNFLHYNYWLKLYVNQLKYSFDHYRRRTMNNSLLIEVLPVFHSASHKAWQSITTLMSLKWRSLDITIA